MFLCWKYPALFVFYSLINTLKYMYRTCNNVFLQADKMLVYLMSSINVKCDRLELLTGKVISKVKTLYLYVDCCGDDIIKQNEDILLSDN